MLLIAFMIIASYLCGSISSAIIVCTLMRCKDPREHGSYNPGATNVLRVAGKLPAFLTLLFDVLKGVVAVFVAKMLGLDGFFLGTIAFFVCLGHVFPCFFDFKGGKGVATAFGSIIVLSPSIAFIAILAWILVVLISRYVSLASLTSLSLATFSVLFFDKASYFIPLLALLSLITWRHWDNVLRLRSRKERKLQIRR